MLLLNEVALSAERGNSDYGEVRLEQKVRCFSCIMAEFALQLIVLCNGNRMEFGSIRQQAGWKTVCKHPCDFSGKFHSLTQFLTPFSCYDWWWLMGSESHSQNYPFSPAREPFPLDLAASQTCCSAPWV